MSKVSKLIVVSLFALSIAVGCATRTKTVQTETVQYPAQQQADPVVAEKQTTTTTETETRGESAGLLSGTVHVVGQVLAFPFRAVGGLIGAIF
ncbi:MAG: hypothetical protein ACREQA_00155 [Candidatus Binatia bacterium]